MLHIICIKNKLTSLVGNKEESPLKSYNLTSLIYIYKLRPFWGSPFLKCLIGAKKLIPQWIYHQFWGK